MPIRASKYCKIVDDCALETHEKLLARKHKSPGEEYFIQCLMFAHEAEKDRDYLNSDAFSCNFGKGIRVATFKCPQTVFIYFKENKDPATPVEIVDIKEAPNKQ